MDDSTEVLAKLEDERDKLRGALRELASYVDAHQDMGGL